MLTEQKFIKILRLRTLRNSKSWHNKQHHFLKVHNETFQMHICKLL